MGSGNAEEAVFGKGIAASKCSDNGDKEQEIVLITTNCSPNVTCHQQDSNYREGVVVRSPRGT